MKVNELMIGDWVLFAGDIYQIHKEDFSANYDFEPIPLTLEIIKKNGYSYNEIRDGWELIPTNGYALCVDDDGKFEFCHGVFDGYHGDIIYHYVADAHYVHELQHALKLCKFKKEINLI